MCVCVSKLIDLLFGIVIIFSADIEAVRNDKWPETPELKVNVQRKYYILES